MVTLRRLVEKGAHLSCLNLDEHPDLALQMLKFGDLHGFRIFLDQGVIHAYGRYQDQPLLHWCAQHGELALVKELVRRQVCVRQVNAAGKTAAEEASRRPEGQVCAAYLEKVAAEEQPLEGRAEGH